MIEKKYNLSKIVVGHTTITMDTRMSITEYVKGKVSLKEQIAFNALMFLAQIRDKEYQEALDSLEFLRDKTHELMEEK